MTNDFIKKQIELRASVSRVWHALTDSGEWFHVKLDAPFAAGQISRGQITYPGYEHLSWEATIQKIERQQIFSFTGHPYAVEPDIDYSAEAPTLVEFKLEKTEEGTRLTLTESGFDQIPSTRRLKAFRMNEGGWNEQMINIERHLA